MELSQRTQSLLHNPEFQSALVRLGIWCFAVLYIGLASSTHYYVVDVLSYQILFSSFFVLFMGSLISVFFREEWPARRYLTLTLDISATSFCIYLTKDVVSPFYLLYIWIFISYGTRYGKSYLKAASMLSLLAYAVLLAALDQWSRYLFEAVFFLLLLILLPLYQYSLLRKLHDARMKAVQSDRAKSAFLSSMTHELRTPLSGILGMAGLLGKTKLDSEQREYLQAIVSSGSILDALIGDALDLSRVEADGLTLKKESVDLPGFTKEIMMTMANQAREKEIELICDVDMSLPRSVEIDPLRVRQVLLNLLGNSIKFTERGEIVFTLSPHHALGVDGCEQLLFKVRDSGIGMTAPECDHVFDRFWQADGSNTSSTSGVGLGTAICKSLVKFMGGEIGVESQVDEGSVFWFTLPLKHSNRETIQQSIASSHLTDKRALVIEYNEQAMAVVASICETVGMGTYKVSQISQLASTLHEIKQDKGVDLVLHCGNKNSRGDRRIEKLIVENLGSVPIIYMGDVGQRMSDPENPAPILPKPVLPDALVQVVESLFASERGIDNLEEGNTCSLKVLMAEDNAINAKVLGTLLKDLGCIVQWAKDGEEALRMSMMEQFDIAFVDLRMPKRDGLSFARDYRASESDSKRMPIIALTANSTADANHQCRSAGMDDFLAKPVDIQTLRLMIKCYAS